MITVALLAYNRENYIEESLGAILNQTKKDYELIIIDNHSTDSTHKKIIELLGERENSTLVRLGGNSNAAISYNTALMYAKNPFVLVTHDDDILSSNYLEKCHLVLAKYPNIGLIGSNVRLINEIGKVTSERLYPSEVIKDDLLIKKKQYLDLYNEKKLWIPTPTHCINRLRYFEYYKNNHVFSSLSTDYSENSKNYNRIEYEPSGDIESCIAINELSSIYFFSEPLLSYRQHSLQESRNVEQAEPLLVLCRNLEKNNYYSQSTKNKASFIKLKYEIQKLFFEANISGLLKILKLNGKKNTLPLISILRELFNVSDRVEDSGTLINDGIYYDLFTKKVNSEGLKGKVVVLVGSMLMAYVIHKALEKMGLVVNYVIDRSPARLGKEIFDKTVISYDELRVVLSENSGDMIDKFIFITTSERTNDSSIKSFLVEKFGEYGVNGASNIVEWRELLVPSRMDN